MRIGVSGLLENRFIRYLVVCLATGFYSGYSPIAPGTAGTLVAVPLYVMVSRLSSVFHALVLLIVLVIAWGLSRRAEVLFLRRDSERIVIDEMAGFLVTMGFVPPAPMYLFLGFIFFRLFDIVKPFPIRRLEGLGGGWGVVADDVMAGIYGHLALRVSLLLF